MIFATDVSTLDKPFHFKVNLVGLALPSSNDIYFRAKQRELVEQYKSARLFLEETETTDWEHWFHQSEDDEANHFFQTSFKANFYECALFYYNVVVDLSWTLCYVAAEFACECKGKRIDINGILPIEEAAEALRSAEKNVLNPNAKTNPFKYLEKMCPEFKPVFDQITQFWDTFSKSSIRKKYNYCKHRGKPRYTEIDDYENTRLMKMYAVQPDSMTELASDIRDVEYGFSLNDSITELHDFDDNQLFPYIRNLIDTIEGVLKPSPLA